MMCKLHWKQFGKRGFMEEVLWKCPKYFCSDYCSYSPHVEQKMLP